MSFEQIGTCGTDSGKLLFADPRLVVGPAFGDAELSACERAVDVPERSGMVLDGAAIVLETGVGDGSYPVFVYRAGDSNPSDGVGGIMVDFGEHPMVGPVVYDPAGTVLIGHCALESGELLLVDPSYVVGERFAEGNLASVDYDQASGVGVGQVLDGLAVVVRSDSMSGTFPVYARYGMVPLQGERLFSVLIDLSGLLSNGDDGASRLRAAKGTSLEAWRFAEAGNKAAASGDLPAARESWQKAVDLDDCGAMLARFLNDPELRLEHARSVVERLDQAEDSGGVYFRFRPGVLEGQTVFAEDVIMAVGFALASNEDDACGRLFDAAVEAFMVRAENDDPEALSNLGLIAEFAGDEEGARKYWERAAALGDQDAIDGLERLSPKKRWWKRG